MVTSSCWSCKRFKFYSQYLLCAIISHKDSIYPYNSSGEASQQLKQLAVLAGDPHFIYPAHSSYARASADTSTHIMHIYKFRQTHMHIKYFTGLHNEDIIHLDWKTEKSS